MTRKGIKFSVEHRYKLSQAKKDKVGNRLGYKKGKNKLCLNCNKEYYQSPAKKAKFCSLQCAINSRKGIKRNEEIGKKISLSKKGKFMGELSSSWRGGANAINKICKQCNKEFGIRKSRNFRVYCSRKCSSMSKVGKSAWNKGMKGFRAGIKRPNIMPRGEKHWSWKGGISINNHSPKEPKYKEWRMKVFTRDNFKCKILNQNCKGQLQAHHILRWADFPELRYDINNGITLCQAHHPRKRAEEKRLSPYFKDLISVSKELY